MKINSPDYKGHMTEDEAKEDFLRRIEHYNIQVKAGFSKDFHRNQVQKVSNCWRLSKKLSSF